MSSSIDSEAGRTAAVSSLFFPSEEEEPEEDLMIETAPVGDLEQSSAQLLPEEAMILGSSSVLISFISSSLCFFSYFD